MTNEFFFSDDAPAVDCAALLDAFLAGDAERGRCEWFHLEGPVLVAHRFTALAIRLSDAVLVRADLPADTESVAADVEAALRRRGATLVETDSGLASVVAIEAAGVRGGMWDVWASDAERARADIARRAAGELGPLLDPEALTGRPPAPDTSLDRYESEFRDGPTA